MCHIVMWKLLPQEVLMTVNIDNFKSKLDKFMKDKEMNYY